MHTINSVFDKVYVINLDRRKDRLIAISQKLIRLGIHFERIEAVDGYTEENIKQFSEYFNRPFDDEKAHELEKSKKRKILMGPGAIGILKSYKNLILDAKENELKRILVFEDDALFIKKFNEKFDGFYEETVNIDWKILALGATQHVWDFPDCLSYSSGKLEYSKKEHYYYPKITRGAFALGLDHRIFDPLLEEIEKMNAPIDSGPVCKIYSENYGECIVAQPNLVVADVSSSDIGKERDQFTLAVKLKWKMDDYDFPFLADLVSVFIPTYNAENALEASVESLINQTYPNIEIIIQDDCSSDNSGRIGRRLAEKYNNVFYYRNNANVGCYKTRNNAIRSSNGRYLAIQDPDDISLANRIEKQVLSLINSRALISIGHIIRTKCEIHELDFKNEKQTMDLVNSRRIPRKNGTYAWLDREILGFNTTMFCREVFINHGLFWEERFSGDAEILERILAEKEGVYLPVDNMNIHSYLREKDSIDDIYIQVNEVVLLSAQMGTENLTNKYIKEARDEFERKWRLKLKGNYHYEYPRLSMAEMNLTNSGNIVGDIQKEEFNRKLENSFESFNATIEDFQNRDNELSKRRKVLEDRHRKLKNLRSVYVPLPQWFLNFGKFIFRR